MDDALPSISSGAVGSRFVSQADIDSAKARRDEQWKAAYARLGQEPPPRPTEDVYDGRSLAEKLAANKAAKQEEWEERTKLANQFRALEEDEVQFLDTIRNEQQKKEQKQKQEDAEEVKGFKQAVAARNNLPDKPPGSTSASGSQTLAKPKPQQVPSVKKTGGIKSALKGVVVKKRKTTDASLPIMVSSKLVSGKPKETETGDADEPSKKRKVS